MRPYVESMRDATGGLADIAIAATATVVGEGGARRTVAFTAGMSLVERRAALGIDQPAVIAEPVVPIAVEQPAPIPAPAAAPAVIPTAKAKAKANPRKSTTP